MTTSLPVRSDGPPSPIVATYLEFDTEIVGTFKGQLWYGAACRKSRLLARGMRHTCFLIPSKMAKSFVYLVRRPPGNSADANLHPQHLMNQIRWMSRVQTANRTLPTMSSHPSPSSNLGLCSFTSPNTFCTHCYREECGKRRDF